VSQKEEVRSITYEQFFTQQSHKQIRLSRSFSSGDWLQIVDIIETNTILSDQESHGENSEKFKCTSQKHSGETELFKSHCQIGRASARLTKTSTLNMTHTIFWLRGAYVHTLPIFMLF
jgi:hypothetical protein